MLTPQAQIQIQENSNHKYCSDYFQSLSKDTPPSIKQGSRHLYNRYMDVDQEIMKQNQQQKTNSEGCQQQSSIRETAPQIQPVVLKDVQEEKSYDFKIYEEHIQDSYYRQLYYQQQFTLFQAVPQLNILALYFKQNNYKQQIEQNQFLDVPSEINLAQTNKKLTTDNFLIRFNQIIRKLQKDDFSALYKDKNAIKVLNFVSEKKYMLNTQIRQDVKYFLDLLNSRIQFFPYANLFYHDLLIAAQKLSNIYEYVGSRRNVSITEKQCNRIYQHLVQEAETKPRRQAVYYVEQKKSSKRISLGQYMAQTPQFFKSKKWRQIMMIVQRQIQKINIQQVKNDNSQIVKILKRLEYSKKIYKMVTLNIGCLGCSDFFFVNWNVFDQVVNQAKLALGGKILDMVSVNSTEEEKKNIIKKAVNQVCALLNSGGGVILYNCETIYLSVIPRGQFLTKAQGQQIEKVIKNQVIKSISPQIEFGKNVVLSFLRILKDPIYEAKQLRFNEIPEQIFVKGLYIVRILVRPTTNIIYRFQENGLFFQAFRYKSISETQIETIEVNNNKKNQIFTTTSQDWVTTILDKPHLQFDHDVCNHSKYCLKAQELPIQKQLVGVKSDDIEKNFLSATAMVVKKQNFEQFQKRLKKLDFDHFCEFPFFTSKVKGANATVILYHSKTVPQITNMINYNSEFEFNGRNTVTVMITDYIKLVTRLNKNVLPYEQFNNLQLWIDHQFKGDFKCTLQMWVEKNEYDELEYYLKVKGNKAVKKCTLFVYLVSNHFGERAQLRGPKEVDKLSLYVYDKMCK